VSLSIGDLRARYWKRECKIERFTLGCAETVIHGHGYCDELREVIRERLIALAEMQEQKRRDKAGKS
jgi:hypothetical protein